LSDRKRCQNNLIGIGITIGVVIGTVVGAVTDNMGFWIAVGTSLGLIFGAGLSAQQKNRVDKRGGGINGIQESSGLMVFFSSNTDTGNRVSTLACRDTDGFYAANGSGCRNGNSNANRSDTDTSDPYFDAPSYGYNYSSANADSLSHRHSG